MSALFPAKVVEIPDILHLPLQFLSRIHQGERAVHQRMEYSVINIKRHSLMLIVYCETVIKETD